jgi:hypothetical protein
MEQLPSYNRSIGSASTVAVSNQPAINQIGSTHANLPAVTSANVGTATAATASVVYAAGGSGVYHVISGISWSYASGTFTLGNLTCVDSANGIWYNQDITSEGTASIKFDPPVISSNNGSFTITLASGGTSVVGKLNILGHWTTS